MTVTGEYAAVFNKVILIALFMLQIYKAAKNLGMWTSLTIQA